MKCSECGKENLELLKREGVVETFKCLSCGNIIHTHVNYGVEEIEKYAKANESNVSISLGSHGGSKKRLMKLRQNVPELKKYSILDLENLASDGKLDLGQVHKSKLENLKEVCEKIGVEILIQ